MADPLLSPDVLTVEAVLRTHADVLDAAVLGPGTLNAGTVALVASDGYATGPDLADHVAISLGFGEVPATIALLPEIPMNGDRTVDVGASRALLASWPAVYHFALPGTARERQLAAIWCRVLDRPWIGVHDDFIDVGGDSYRAAVILTELTGIGADVSVGDLFEMGTIAGLAARIDSCRD
ncbi:phosphopantetheine-binding protein [Nonomuraea sp. NPDC050643]|uniref:phosphopantetheine-binding protein n=1 Tax=Nonomuraea sp. NPDC050643 TaxID=3155660 RepID=UPI003409FE40